MNNDDHERSRRELAVKLCQDWTKGLKLESSPVVALVASLSAEQCDDLAGRKPICLDDTPSNRNAVTRCLEYTYKEFNLEKLVNGVKINVDGDYIIFIRFNAIYYLNLLESILTAWNLGVAHESILEDQFKFLTLGDQTLEN
jgi:hypothetical protein